MGACVCVCAAFRRIKMTLHNLWLRRLLSSPHSRTPLPPPADTLNIEWGQNFCLEPLLSSSPPVTGPSPLSHRYTQAGRLKRSGATRRAARPPSYPPVQRPVGIAAAAWTPFQAPESESTFLRLTLLSFCITVSTESQEEASQPSGAISRATSLYCEHVQQILN